MRPISAAPNEIAEISYSIGPQTDVPPETLAMGDASSQFGIQTAIFNVFAHVWGNSTRVPCLQMALCIKLGYGCVFEL